MSESVTPKSFPDLMAGKKVLYVHGFLSAGSTHTATVLRQFMPQATVLAPDLPVHPEEAMQLLRDLVASEKPDLIIGTSMGGMYTEMLYGVDRICVNPAFEMGSTMTEHNMMGKQVFQNPRQDGVQELIVTKALVKEYREMTSHCFEQVDAEEQQRVFGLFGDADPVVHTFDLFHQHYPNAVRFHGEHRLLEKVIYHYLIPVVRWIDDRQEQRERPTVFIHWNTLMDDYGKPKSSLHKAYEFLIEHYNVYIVAPSQRALLRSMRKRVRGWKMYLAHLLGDISSSLISCSCSMAITSSVPMNPMNSLVQPYGLAQMSLRHGRK